MSHPEILHTFNVDGAEYKLPNPDVQGRGLYRVKYDPLRTQYVTKLDPQDWAVVLERMTRSPMLAGCAGIVDWSEKWKAISTEAKHTRYVVMGRAAVEVGGGKVRMFLLEEAKNESLESTQPRWVETVAYGAYCWILDVIRMILEAP